jgi:hypothetical protein
MREYKVGTLSIGILFVFLGVGMLTNQFFDFSFAGIVLTWWPVLLILLGGEILFYLWLKRNAEDPKLKYDLASIFIVLLFGMASIGLYSLQETGVLQVIKANLHSTGYEIQTSPQVIDDLQGVEKIKVIGNPRNLNIYSSGESRLTMYANWRNIYASNKEEAHQITSQLIKTKRSGSTLFITLNKPTNQNKFANDSYGFVSLYLPSTIEAETDLQYSDIKLYLEQLTSSWNIRTLSGRITAHIEEENDLMVQATSLHGDISEDTTWTSTNENKTEGQLIVGEGTYVLGLFTEHGRIEISQ